jgi:hypothetical protein
MSDFLMTMSSDDEAAPSTSTLKATKPERKGKLTRKEQLEARKSNKASKAKQNKRKRKEGSSDEDDGKDEMVVDPEDDHAMDNEFTFDGLGGGFVGEKRMSVWDGGQSYLPVKPNAIVRHHLYSIHALKTSIAKSFFFF